MSVIRLDDDTFSSSRRHASLSKNMLRVTTRAHNRTSSDAQLNTLAAASSTREEMLQGIMNAQESPLFPYRLMDFWRYLNPDNNDDLTRELKEADNRLKLNHLRRVISYIWNNKTTPTGSVDVEKKLEKYFKLLKTYYTTLHEIFAATDKDINQKLRSENITNASVYFDDLIKKLETEIGELSKKQQEAETVAEAEAANVKKQQEVEAAKKQQEAEEKAAADAAKKQQEAETAAEAEAANAVEEEEQKAAAEAAAAARLRQQTATNTDNAFSELTKYTKMNTKFLIAFVKKNNEQIATKTEDIEKLQEEQLKLQEAVENLQNHEGLITQFENAHHIMQETYSEEIKQLLTKTPKDIEQMSRKALMEALEVLAS